MIYEICCYKNNEAPIIYRVRGFENSELVARMMSRKGYVVMVDKVKEVV